MKAAVLTEVNKPLEILDIDRPQPGPGRRGDSPGRRACSGHRRDPGCLRRVGAGGERVRAPRCVH